MEPSRLARIALFVVGVALGLVASRGAFASIDASSPREQLERAAVYGSPQTQAEAYYLLADADERDMHFASALAHYEASLAHLPSNRYAQRSEARASYLRSHAEGDFVPLTRLEQIRRDPNATADAAAMDRLAHDAETFPKGAVRNEARMVVAEAYFARLGRPGDAHAPLAAILAEDDADPLLRQQAAQRLVELDLAGGRFADAKSAAARVAKEQPALLARVHRLERRHWLHFACISVVVAFALLAVVGTIRGRKRLGGEVRAFLPWVLAFAAYVGAMGAMLASSYERGNALPFVAFAASLVPLALLSRGWGAAGAPTPTARAGRALMSILAVLAAAFLLLERIDSRYLESFGL